LVIAITHDNPTEPLAGDILENIAEVAMFLGKSERQAKLLLEKGELPRFRLVRAFAKPWAHDLGAPWSELEAEAASMPR
jgi:hypothetical protein